MSGKTNFEPFLNWQAINDEMAKDLHTAFVKYERAKAIFLKTPTPENAAEILLRNGEISAISEAINETIYTVPMMVHVASTPAEEDDGHDGTVHLQRCKRCGSVLQFFREGMAAMTPNGPQPVEYEMVPWWTEDDLVAKANGPQAITMYEVPKGRELEKHEHWCPDLSGLS